MGGGEAYWDEDGVMHRHDPNQTTAGYRCSNGHEWVERTLSQCPAPECDYGQQKGLEG